MTNHQPDDYTMVKHPRLISPIILMVVVALTSAVPSFFAFNMLAEITESLALSNRVDLTFLFLILCSVTQALNMTLIAKLSLGHVKQRQLTKLAILCCLFSIAGLYLALSSIFVTIPGLEFLWGILTLLLFQMSLWLATVSSFKIVFQRRLPVGFTLLILVSAFIPASILTFLVVSVSAAQIFLIGAISTYLCTTIPSLVTTAYLTRYRQIINPETIEIQP